MRPGAAARHIGVVTQASSGAAVPMQARRWASRVLSRPDAYAVCVAAMLVGVAAVLVYVLPGLPDPAAHWPL
jgi:hypothetical protein